MLNEQDLLRRRSEQEKEAIPSHYEVVIDGEVVIDHTTPHTENGTFLTENFGELTFQKPQLVRRLNGLPSTERIAVISGEALKSNSRKAIRNNNKAAQGIIEVSMGWVWQEGKPYHRGIKQLGKDPLTSNLRSLEVRYVAQDF